MKPILFASLAILIACAATRADEPVQSELTRNAQEPVQEAQGLELVENLQDQVAKWMEENLTEEQISQLPQFDREQFVTFFQPVIDSLAADDFEAMATIREHAAHGLALLRANPLGASYADWLEARMDYLDVAVEVARTWREQWEKERTEEIARRERELEAFRRNGTPIVKRPTPRPEDVKLRIERSAGSDETWRRKVATRPAPAAAARYVPQLKKVFAAEGVPPELVWIAEVESSFNPKAQSPVGARGLFQFMPATAKHYGLSTFPFDERTNPEKSARAAAQYLKVLHRRFNDWPLALAAYNAGEGRVGRLLERHKARDFESIAPRLPAETRLYVPKVLATVAAREGIEARSLPAPR
ncbi:MAG TPA: lytic transglycosylase domain-containing protein [Opitutaceae bacterium]|nr:lytic transglycosylase domain-containing protein [Opitutaceae bacterium]